MADIEIDIKGLDGIVDKMSKLPSRLQRSGLRKAARQAANIIRNDARRRARALDDPETPEKIWKNIIVQESRRGSRRVGGVMMRVGVRGGASRNQHSKDASQNPGGDTRHWRFKEFGTAKTAAQPFMRPAASANAQAAVDKLAEVLSQEIDKAAT